MESKVNPKVSVWTQERNPYKGEELHILDLYTVLKQCEIGIVDGAGKGKSGSVFPYCSNTANASSLVFDRGVFVDIDECSKFSKEIFNSFDKLCQVVPNILAVNYSYSGNLHFYLYDKNLKGGSVVYEDLAVLYLCCVARAIKNVLGIDLREVDGALDTHSKSPYQRMFLNKSDFKWNIHCTEVNVNNATKKLLKSEYFKLYNNYNGVRTIVETKEISGDGSTVIDKDYNLLGYGTGYDARTYIAAAAYYHFKEDIEKAREYLSATFANANEINKQMTSMIANRRIEGKFRKDVEDFLFGIGVGEEYVLKDGEYLSDVIDVDKLNDKYYYIQSNTGTGKTEFVKGFIKKTDGNAIIVQITKALRDGKSKGIENITYGNWDTIVDRSRIHTTIEGAVRNCSGMDLSNYTVVVDESHLLEEYIEVRESITRELLTILKSAGKVIFMSATPKSDINLFPFKKMNFKRIQNQEIKIYQYPMKIEGNGSKEAVKYEWMVERVKELSKIVKVIVFSNKNQESWKKYGLENERITYFNANNINDSAVQSILKDNKLVNDLTLSTKYMGCGVEVKGEEEVHEVFCLDEGMDIDFIIQSIGRPRVSGGVKRIVVHLFYTKDRKWSVGVDKDSLLKFKEAFKNLVIEEMDMVNVNILAAKMIGIYDPNFSKYEVKDQVEMLWMGNYINQRLYHTPYSVDLFKQLPYKKIEIINLPDKVLNSDGRVRRMREEKELMEYLLSLNSSELMNLGCEEGYDKLIESGEIPYNDKTNARKVLKDVRYIVSRGFELGDAVTYFENVRLAAKMIGSLMNYAKVKAGKMTVKEFEGSEEVMGKLEEEFDMVRRVFNESYIQKLIDRMMGVPEQLDVEVDDVFADVMELNDVEQPTPEKKEEVFNGESYKEVKKMEGIGKRIGNSKKGIRIERLSDGQVFEFDSKGDAREWLGWSTQKFSKFVKNQVDKKETYKLLT